MGKVRNNLATKGFSGKISDEITYRQVDGLTLFARSRGKSRKPLTPAQVERQVEFKAAVYYAKSALMDAEVKAAYKAMAEKANLKSANIAAVTDYLLMPEIASVFSGSYRGEAGNVIYIAGVDHFKLHKVEVSILLPNGTILESGEAQRQEKDWKYVATQVNAVVAGSMIVVKAKDRPGKEVTFEKML